MLIDDFKQAVRARNCADSTFEAYWGHVLGFLKFTRHENRGEWIRPHDLEDSTASVTRYLTWLANAQNVSASTQN